VAGIAATAENVIVVIDNQITKMTLYILFD
jgi:hypothetical protein